MRVRLTVTDRQSNRRYAAAFRLRASGIERECQRYRARVRAFAWAAVAQRATIPPFKVGGHGKPVRSRRGPATVIGDASRTDSHWVTRVSREGAAGRPVSQETSRRPQSRYALVERGGPHESQNDDRAWRSARDARLGIRIAGAGKAGARDSPDRRTQEDPARRDTRQHERRRGEAGKPQLLGVERRRSTEPRNERSLVRQVVLRT